MPMKWVAEMTADPEGWVADCLASVAGTSLEIHRGRLLRQTGVILLQKDPAKMTGVFLKRRPPPLLSYPPQLRPQFPSSSQQ